MGVTTWIKILDLAGAFLGFAALMTVLLMLRKLPLQGGRPQRPN